VIRSRRVTPDDGAAGFELRLNRERRATFPNEMLRDFNSTGACFAFENPERVRPGQLDGRRNQLILPFWEMMVHRAARRTRQLEDF